MQTFAIMGGLYAAVSCFSKRLRQKDDGELRNLSVVLQCLQNTKHFVNIQQLHAHGSIATGYHYVAFNSPGV